jgi:FkbM family methyltransferase
MNFKDLLKKALIHLHLDVTKNMQYDRYTRQIMKHVLKPDSNCIDIGCFKGEILEEMIKLAPDGRHFAFEPLHDYFEQLIGRFSGKATIFPYALTDSEGISEFKYVKNAPAYSGLKIRDYNIKKPDIETIGVETRPLDTLIPESCPIHFIKIDVEGGEFQVFIGARNLLKRNKPVVVFESGISASKYYNTKPEEIFDFLTNQVNLKLSLLKDFIGKKRPLTRSNFLKVYNSEQEYYFVAHL